jgi:NAD(P)-dependent dehydrogenase (short-subunit alcohol dehydrogenase family)
VLRTWRDSVSIVTGGGSGLGLALGRELLARGAARVVLADVRADAAEEAARELGPNASAATLDVRDLEAFRALAASVASREGRIDYLFNNAGTAVLGTAERHRPEDWKLVLDVNLYGAVNGIQAVYPIMIGQRFGHLVNTASIVGLVPAPLLAAYVASKHAIVGLTRVLRLEAAHHSVRVSALCPGVVRTPMFTDGLQRPARPIPEEKRRASREKVDALDPDVFAKAALDGVAKNRELIVVPRALGAMAWLFRVMPSLERAALAKELARARVQLPELFEP